MRNLKFLFISFFLVLVSVSSTFAAITFEESETTYTDSGLSGDVQKTNYITNVKSNINDKKLNIKIERNDNGSIRERITLTFDVLGYTVSNIDNGSDGVNPSPKIFSGSKDVTRTISQMKKDEIKLKIKKNLDELYKWRPSSNVDYFNLQSEENSLIAFINKLSDIGLYSFDLSITNNPLIVGTKVVNNTIPAGTIVPTGNANTPKTYTGFTILSLSKDYIDSSLSVEIAAYTGACNLTNTNNKEFSAINSELTSCAKKIAKKITDANDAGLKRFIDYNSSELNKKLTASYNVRVKNRQNVNNSIIIKSTGAIDAIKNFSLNKYNYFNDDIDLDILTGSILFTVTPPIDSKIIDVIKANMQIEIDEVIKAKEFKVEFDKLKISPNTNAKLTAVYELSKIIFTNDSDNKIKDSFYNTLISTIVNTTTKDSKVEQKFVANITADTVRTNKEVRGQKLNSYIRGYKKDQSKDVYDISKLKANGKFFIKNSSIWTPNITK